MIATYLKRFQNLHTDKNSLRWSEVTCYRAPHKPLLLLAVLDLFAEGNLLQTAIELSPELGELFTLYWSKVMPPDRRGNIALPFFHLRTDGFWHLEPQPGKKAILEATHQISTIGQLRTLVRYAKLDEELFALLCMEEPRNLLRVALIQTYFAADLQGALVEQSRINIDSYSYSKQLLEQAREQQIKELVVEADEYRPAVRNQGFRRAIITAYEHRCAFCGLRIVTADGHTAVDAAHIIPWSLTQNDSLHNGMALCQLCHWVFDEGLISVSSAYILLVSPQVTQKQNYPGIVQTLEGRSLIGPQDRLLWPDQEALVYHHQKIYRKR